jgi:beta-glucosidase-like glycosyl hydrolase/CubicO group peptidase (beta-lactamase class C family)
MFSPIRYLSSCAILLTLLGIGCGPSAETPVQQPGTASVFRPPVGHEGWVDSVLATMSDAEKVGQLVMVGLYGQYFSTQTDEHARLVHLIRDHHVGGFILWQGDVLESAVRLNSLQRMSRLPLLVSGDYERGLPMRIRRGTPFPDAMAMGATRNPRYAYEVGRAIAREARAIGVHQNYAPVADVNTNPMNPVINTRSFGEDVRLVQDMVAAFVKGTLDGGALPTAKHFPGHGDTGVDSHLDLPVVQYSRDRLDSVELAPFRTAIDAGTPSIMIAHIAVPVLDTDRSLPSSLSTNAIGTVLQEQLGFNGLVVTDAMDMRGVTRDFSPGQSTVMAVKAGVDIVLMPPDEDAAFDALLAAVRSGEISRGRLDVSVRKILTAKQRLGLDTLRTVDIDRIPEIVGSRDHRLLSREVARSAVTVLKNLKGVFPLATGNGRRVVSIVLSDSQDSRVDINRPGNPWPCEPPGAYFHQQLQRRIGRVETYRLSPSSSAMDIETAAERMKKADLVFFPVYVKVRTSSGRIGMPPAFLSILKAAESVRVPVVAVLFGNPYLAAHFPDARGVLCAYGDSEPQVEAAVEALFGEIGVCGKLPVTIAAGFPFGSGLVCPADRLRREDPVEAGFVPERLSELDRIITTAIRDSAFPAAQLLVLRDGKIAYNQPFGTYTYDPASGPIDNASLFDLASVSKVIGTTTAVMKLIDARKLLLDDYASKYLPHLAAGSKAKITIRHLLTHRAGFPPFKRFFLMCDSAAEALDSVYATELVAEPGDTTIYSDIGMITMGKILERVSGMSQAVLLENEFFGPLGMKNTMYNPPRVLWERVVPTEIDTLWRKALVRGIVHDENAALLGGVAGHAGLFSTASDLAVYVQMLLNHGTYGGVRYLAEGTVVEFTGAHVDGQDRYLGWDMKSPTGSSAGTLFSPSSFGHTGFTGTSIWVDPERKLAVILLTNRVHPTRANQKLSHVRPAVHDAVVRALAEDTVQILQGW